MAIQPGEWDYLYQTTVSSQIPWELGGPDTCLERLVQEKKIPAQSTVLDIGCGLGSSAVYLAALGHQVTAIDLSPSAIAKARQKAEQVGVTVEFLVGDALAMPLKGRRFDFLYDRGCLQHISRERWPLYKREVLRLLKPRGRMALEVAQDQVSLDDLRKFFGTSLILKEATGVTHVERPTNIPRYHTFVYLVRR